MTTVVIDVLLCLAVLGAWFGTLGFARLRDPLDRLHCVAFVAIVTTVPVTAATWLADGASARALKLTLVALSLLAIGAATAHAAGRTILLRPERDDP